MYTRLFLAGTVATSLPLMWPCLASQEPQAPASPIPRSASGQWVDFDGDGLQDLAVVSDASGLQLLRNNGRGGFEDATHQALLEGIGPVVNACWADYDGDGFLDLALIPAGASLRLLHNARGSFDDMTVAAGVAHESPAACATWRDYDLDGRFDLTVVGSLGARLYHNVGGGMFEGIQLPNNTAALVQALADASRPTAAPTETGDQDQPDPAKQDSRIEAMRTWLASSVSSPAAAALPDTAGLGFGSCVPSLEDAAGGPCIEASSVPGLGKLLPLGLPFFVDAVGKVGMGTTAPAEDLHIMGDDPCVRLGRTVDPNSYIELTDASSNTMRLDKVAASGIASIDITPDPLDGVGIATVRLFRNTKTAGAKRFQIHQGDGSSNVQVQLGVEGEKSYLDGGGYVGINTKDPLADLHVDGGATFDARDGGKNGNVVVASSSSVAEQGGLIFTQYVDYPAAKEGWKFYTTSSGTVGNSRLSLGTIEASKPDTVAEVLTLRGSKRVGINTTSPEATLHVNGTTRTNTLTIVGGSDLVEMFRGDPELCSPGTVVVLDPSVPGGVRPSNQAYDGRVMGVVSGAGGVRPGLRLSQTGVLDGEVEVSLQGRVYVHCCAENGPVEPGDLLTASSTKGHAMKASDRERLLGGVLGKALTPLQEGTGLVLVLVNLH